MSFWCLVHQLGASAGLSRDPTPALPLLQKSSPACPCCRHHPLSAPAAEIIPGTEEHKIHQANKEQGTAGGMGGGAGGNVTGAGGGVTGGNMGGSSAY